MAYCTVTQADQYLNNRAFTNAWQESTEKEGFLVLASELIFQYCFFTDKDGEPFRYEVEESDVEIPDFLVKATAEEALYLLNLGKDPTQADKKTTLGIASTEGTVFDKSFAADILCVNCRSLLESNGGAISTDAVAGDGFAWGWIQK